MIITRTPLRMSFVGGGSDMPSYYTQFGGAVISTAIDKYIYVTVNGKFDNALRVSYSKTEIVNDATQLEHELVRAALHHSNIQGGLEITTIADIPSSGTGLGSSSSFTVGLLRALYAYKGQYVPAKKLASDACHLEIDVCGAPIGKQDQYAAAYGGFNIIKFRQNGQVEVLPLICPQDAIDTLQRNTLVFYTGKTRSANSILAEQSKNSASSAKVQEALHKMVAQTHSFAKAMQNSDCHAVGEILHEAWELKKNLASGISDSEIDVWYAAARKAGAVGGKLLGAGAGGFLMFYAPQERHDAIIHALPSLRFIPFGFEKSGCSVIFYNS